MPLAAAIVGILLAAAPVPAEGDGLMAVVHKTLDAHGGEKALLKARTMRQVGTVASTVRGGTSGRMTRIFQHPDRLRVEIAYPGEELEVRVLDRDRGFRRGTAVRGPPLEAMVLQAARMALPLLLQERRNELVDLGNQTVGGKSYRAIEPPLSKGLRLTAYVDPATGLIFRSGGRAGHGPSEIEFATAYADFRKVDGVLIAFQEKTYALGRHTGNTALEKVELLSAPPEGAFRP